MWCPKYRRTQGVDVRFKEIIHEVVAERQAEVIGLEIMPDHVHLLVEVDPQFGIAPIGATAQRTLFTDAAAGVPAVAQPPADLMGKQLLGRHGGGGAACRH